VRHCGTFFKTKDKRKKIKVGLERQKIKGKRQKFD
jgi:hypothetical protein